MLGKVVRSVMELMALIDQSWMVGRSLRMTLLVAVIVRKLLGLFDAF